MKGPERSTPCWTAGHILLASSPCNVAWRLSYVVYHCGIQCSLAPMMFRQWTAPTSRRWEGGEWHQAMCTPVPSLKVIKGCRVLPSNTGVVRWPSPQNHPLLPMSQDLLPALAQSQTTPPALRLLMLSVSLHPVHSASNCPKWVCISLLPGPKLNTIIPQLPIQWTWG